MPIATPEFIKKRQKRKLAVTTRRNELETPREKYVWYRDRKIIGTTLLLCAVAMQIFAFLKVPFFTTIHGYTIGMVFGYYNPFFYGFVAFISLGMIFGKRVRFPHHLRISAWTYWGFALLVIFIASSLSYYQARIGWTTIGAKAWDATTVWFDDFRADVWYTPANTNGGVLGAIFYSLLAMCVSGIGVIVISILLLLSLVSYAVYRILRRVNERKAKASAGKRSSSDSDEVGAKELPQLPNQRAVNKLTIAKEQGQEAAATSQQEVKPVSEPTDLPFDDPFDK